MSQTSDKVAYAADDVGVLLHTALRKLCDSAPTTYAWNVIHLLDESWKAFCQQIAEAQPTTPDEIKKIALSESWWPQDSTRESHYARQIFSKALREFDDNDWEGFTYYLLNER